MSKADRSLFVPFFQGYSRTCDSSRASLLQGIIGWSLLSVVWDRSNPLGHEVREGA